MRLQAAGYNATSWGENIAAGQPDPQAVMTAWMNSPDSRAKILLPGFTEIGIGMYQDATSQYGIYWTQELGTMMGSEACIGGVSGLPIWTVCDMGPGLPVGVDSRR